jgi:hypothetical protein
MRSGKLKLIVAALIVFAVVGGDLIASMSP